jgi:hypothetical protein
VEGMESGEKERTDMLQYAIDITTGRGHLQYIASHITFVSFKRESQRPVRMQDARPFIVFLM